MKVENHKDNLDIQDMKSFVLSCRCQVYQFFYLISMRIREIITYYADYQTGLYKFLLILL